MHIKCMYGLACSHCLPRSIRVCMGIAAKCIILLFQKECVS